MRYDSSDFTPLLNPITLSFLIKYIKAEPTGDSYQSESDTERELIQDLQNQGYEFIS